MVLFRGRPLFLTQIEWDLTLILPSQIKVRKVSSFGHYMYSEYKRIVQMENFNGEILCIKRPSSITFNFACWFSPMVFFCLFAFSSIVFFQFSFAILSFSVTIVTHVHLSSAAAFSFARWSLTLITTLQFYLSQWIVSLGVYLHLFI